MIPHAGPPLLSVAVQILTYPTETVSVSVSQTSAGGAVLMVPVVMDTHMQISLGIKIRKSYTFDPFLSWGMVIVDSVDRILLPWPLDGGKLRHLISLAFFCTHLT